MYNLSPVNMVESPTKTIATDITVATRDSLSLAGSRPSGRLDGVADIVVTFWLELVYVVASLPDSLKCEGR